MPLKRNHLSCAVLTVAMTLGAASGLALAQETAAPPSTAQPSVEAAPSKLLTLTEIESKLVAQGIRVREMEVKDKVLEVEGDDAQGRKIELLVDRRSGEVLSRKHDR